MKNLNSFHKTIQQLYQEQKNAEKVQAPAFYLLFDQAQQKHRRMKNQKWFVVSLALVALSLIGLSFMDKEAPSGKENISIAKAGMPLYDILMKDGKIITNDIHFDYNKTSIRSSSMTIIRSIAEMMEEHTDIRLSIEGHTDDRGAGNYNMELSHARAMAVRDALISLSIDASRLSTKGLGETRPLSTNTTEAGRAINRRVEFVKN